MLNFISALANIFILYVLYNNAGFEAMVLAGIVLVIYNINSIEK